MKKYKMEIPDIDDIEANSKYPQYVFEYPDGAFIQFDKLFKSDNKSLNNFDMRKKRAMLRGSNTKRSHLAKENSVGKLDAIVTTCRYVNHFINFYDKEKSLLTGYLQIRYIMEKNDKLTTDSFIDLLTKFILTPSFIKKVRMMTKKNYKLELDSSAEKSKEKYPDKMRFTDAHAKILYDISFAMRAISFIITCYLSRYNKSSRTCNKVISR